MESVLHGMAAVASAPGKTVIADYSRVWLMVQVPSIRVHELRFLAHDFCIPFAIQYSE